MTCMYIAQLAIYICVIAFELSHAMYSVKIFYVLPELWLFEGHFIFNSRVCVWGGDNVKI